MSTVWESMPAGFDDESVVVVPSISIERTHPRERTIMQAMEERALFSCCSCCASRSSA